MSSADQPLHATLRKNAVGVGGIIFFVIATNGPLTALVGGTPAAMTFGNGVGLPGVFVLVGLVYLLFCVGFAAMARHVKNAGAFYAYVSHGLGQPLGVGAAFMAIGGYAALNLALYALFGFFGSQFLSNVAGVEAPWWALCAGAVVVVHLSARRNIEFNGRMLAILMLAEVAIIVVFNLGVLLTGGPDGFVPEAFAPANVLTMGLGSSVVFVISSFMGFETAAIYSEEARDPTRTVPRAIYASVLIIMGLYSISTWLMIVAYGPTEALSVAAADPGNLWLAISTRVLGPWSAQVLEVLMLTSLFAAILSFHNTLSRYLFSLGREGVIWRGFSRTHEKEDTPVVASAAQAAVMFVTIGACVIAGADPLAQIMPVSAAAASIGIVAVQCLTALAILGFFRKNARGTTSWQRTIAPTISFVSLGTFLVLMIINMSLLTGGQPLIDVFVPLLVLGLGSCGFLYTLWLRSHRPSVFTGLTRIVNDA